MTNKLPRPSTITEKMKPLLLDEIFMNIDEKVNKDKVE